MFSLHKVYFFFLYSGLQPSTRMSNKLHYVDTLRLIGVARGEQRSHVPPKFLENIVILCFERRFSKQNSVIRLKSNILAPPKFWAGYATAKTL